MECLGPGTVIDFVRGRLSGEALAAVDRHLDACAECRALVAAAARDGAAMSDARTEHARPRAPVGAAEALDSDIDAALANDLTGALEPPRDPYVGKTLGGRYRVVRKLGQGGMGAVYEAEHTLIGRAVAIKVLHPAFAANRDVLRRFIHEARAAATIAHPNIIEATDFGRAEDGSPFLVLELLRGRDLGEHLARTGPLPIAGAVRIAIDVASALEAAHAKGIVHRDLKPENVFMTDTGAIKVLDFGISKVAGSIATGLGTQPGAVMGTPLYMAPEQFTDSASADSRSDVYALGVILFRMLTGRVPYEADTLQGLVLRILGPERPSLRSARPDVPEALEAAVLRAMEARREARFDSMRALIEAIARFRDEPGSRVPEAARAESRVLTALVARGVRDADAIRRLVADAGGVVTVDADASRAIAIFGGETWRGDEPARALLAALEARHAADSFGVATGRARRSATGWSGDAVAQAEAAATRALAGVAATPEAVRGLESSFAVRRVEAALCEVTARSRAGWSILPVTSDLRALVGRDIELAQLRAALEAVRATDRAAFLLVTGPPGIGKSRIAGEMLRMADAAGVCVLAARAEPSKQERALSLIAAAIAARARWGSRALGWPRIDAEAGADERRRALERLVGEAIEDLERARACADALAPLLGLDTTLEASARVRADRIRLGARDYLSGLLSRGPVVLLLEDLQWADRASLDLVGDLLEDGAASPLLVFATARPEGWEGATALTGAHNAIELKLKGIGPSDVRALTRAVAACDLDAPVLDAIVERTAGNPLFVEQIVGALRDEGALTRAAELDARSLPLPLTVEAAVQARLDALTPAERDVCARAAVFGRPLSSRELGALGAPASDEILTSLASRDVLARSDGRHREGPRAYRFRTSLVADVAYRMLGRDETAALHRRAASVLADLGDGDDEEIALHLERGGSAREACERYARAALSAATRADTASVLRCSDRALRLGVAPARAFGLRMARAEALLLGGRLADQATELEHALLLASTPGESARAFIEQAACFQRTGATSDALSAIEAAVAAAASCDDAEIVACAFGTQATALLYAGRTAEAADALAKAERLVLTKAPRLRAQAAAWRGQIAGALGDLGERRNAYWAAVELYREAGDPRSAAGAELNLADAYNRFGAYDEAEQALESALEACRKLRMRIMEGYALANLAYSRLMRGLTERAIETAEQALAIANEADEVRLALFCRLYRARALLDAGDTDRAVREAVEVAERAQKLDAALPAAVLALAIVAHARLRGGDVQGALEASDRALALRDRLGGVEEDEGEVFLARAEALAAAGDARASAEVRARGRGRVLDVAARIGDAEWRERFVQDVAAHRALVGPTP